MKSIAIVGVTITGNMGGQAMLLATLEAMRQRYPGCRFYLLSIYPKADKKINKIEDLTIVPARAPILVSFYLPLALMLWPFIKISVFNRLLACFPYFKALSQADLVIDLCGISFVDGRGILLLIYNVACFLPAIILGKPVVKLSQAMGPFKKPLNRFVAKLTLSRCAFVIVRGSQSARNIENLGISNTMMLPDVTFSLGISESARHQARTILTSHNIGQMVLVVSPSRVVQKLCLKAGINFVDEMVALLKELNDRGVIVLFLPHSYAKGSSKNNDVAVCQAILERMPQGHSIKLIDDIQDATLLWALIGEASLFVGSRFHSVIAALSMGVPCLVIGWGHKYAEMLAPFGLTDWVLDFSAFSVDVMLSYIKKLQEKSSEVRNQIQAALPVVRKQASVNFDVATKVLNQ